MTALTSKNLRDRAGLVAAVLGCLVAGGLALFAAGRGWVGFTVEQPPLPTAHETASGHTVAAVVAPLALVVLAGIVAFPATRGIGRRLAGALVTLAGAGLVAAAVTTAASPANAVASEAARLTGRAHAEASSAAITGWPWLVVACGLLAVAAGALALLFARDWPTMGRRYEAGAPATRGDDPASMWDRLDRGDDPTA
jgi:uncharacterized membrane protein (TIGR02234 family)